MNTPVATYTRRKGFVTLMEGPRLRISFPYDPDTVAKVRSLKGRQWHSKEKVWSCLVLKESVEQLKSWGFAVRSDVLSSLQPKGQGRQITGLKGSLLPFQAQGVEAIELRGGRALLADEMGLGKTVQALAWLQLHPELRPAVIVCPASMKLYWETQARAWMTNPRTQVLNGKAEQVIEGDVVIVNYDILPNDTLKVVVQGKTKVKEIPNTGWVNRLARIKPKAVIIDEAHYIKESSTWRTKAFKKLVRGCPHVVAMTGTPLLNRPMELYTVLQVLSPSLFPSAFSYGMRYCAGKHNGFGWDFTGASNTEELYSILSGSVMIRRLKKDVLPQLPDKRYTVVPLALEKEAQKQYAAAASDLITWVRQHYGDEKARKAAMAEALVRLGTLERIAVKGKMKEAIAWIKNFLDSTPKLVVFAIHISVVDALMKEFGTRAVKVDGSVTGAAREEAVTRFQTDPSVELFVGNIQAAGVGLTLTAASSVAFIELPATPGELAQAIDRVHRIGQKDAVNAFFLVAQGYGAETAAALLGSKLSVINQVVDGHTDGGDQDPLQALLNSWTAPERN